MARQGQALQDCRGLCRACRTAPQHCQILPRFADYVDRWIIFPGAIVPFNWSGMDPLLLNKILSQPGPMEGVFASVGLPVWTVVEPGIDLCLGA